MSKYKISWKAVRLTKAGRPMPGGGYEKKCYIVELPGNVDPKSPDGTLTIWKILKEKTDWGRENYDTLFEVVEKME